MEHSEFVAQALEVFPGSEVVQSVDWAAGESWTGLVVPEPEMKNIRDQAWNALSIAAERMGENDYRAGLAAHIKAGRKRHTYRHTCTQAHLDIVCQLGKVLRSDEEAENGMAMLWEYDVMKSRGLKP